MAHPIDILMEVAPELSGEPLSRIGLFLELAAARISPAVFGKVYPQAVAYLAAHLMTVSGRAEATGSASPGAVQSATTGGVSVSFGASTAHKTLGDESLSSTAYGLEYLALRNSRAGTKMKLIRP